MFERFTEQARRVVVAAEAGARERKVDRLRSEHLLGALFTMPDHPARTILEGFGVRADDVAAALDSLGEAARGRSDAEALATLGLDIDEVRRQVEDAFGPGALDRTRAASRRVRTGFGRVPFDRDAKKVLELSLREAVRLGHRHIGTEHLLLGMLHAETGRAHDILAARGVRLAATRIIVEEIDRGRRAG